MTKFNQPPVTISVLALSEKVGKTTTAYFICLLYTSDAADE